MQFSEFNEIIQLGGIMKKLFFIFCLVFVTFLNAQDDFKDWKNAQENQFINFKSKEDKAFYEFLKQSWSEFDAYQGLEKDTEPKLPKPPVVKNVEPVKVEKDLPAKPAVFHVEEAENEENIYFAVDKKLPVIEIDYYGILMDYNYQTGLEVDLSKTDQEAIAAFWLKASNSDYEKLIEQLQTQRVKMKLNDWGYCLLVDKISDKVSENDEKLHQLFNWFFLLKSGYDCKIGYNEDNIYVLLPIKNNLYGIAYIEIDNQRYYAVDFQKQKPLKMAINTYEGNYPEADDLIDMSMESNPKIKTVIVEKVLKFTYDGKKYELPVKYDANVAEFFRSYPQTDLDVYFEAPLSDLALSSLSESFAPILQNRNESEAANVLLRFVQTAFQYQTDDEQFGKEKTFFADEVLFYPACDCEDRSILYSYLVRRILQLDVIGLNYPGHIATAVKLNSDLDGDHILYKNSKYVISDPTYINANIGVAMPKFKEIQPEIIELSNKWSK